DVARARERVEPDGRPVEPEAGELRQPAADHLLRREAEQLDGARGAGDDGARRRDAEDRVGGKVRAVRLVALEQEEPAAEILLREPLLDHARAPRDQLERARVRDLVVAVHAERTAELARVVDRRRAPRPAVAQLAV